MMTWRWPNGLWRAADPSQTDVRDVDHLALRTGLHGGYTPVMTVRRAALPPGEGLEDLAVSALARFSAQTRDAHLLRSTLSGAPGERTVGLSQMLAAQAEIDGAVVDLRHLDGLIGSRQVEGWTAVLILSLTCLADQLAIVGPEFGAMLTSLSPES